MTVFKLKTQFIFNGEFKIEADNREQAKECFIKHCGLVLDGNVHSTLPDDEVDWTVDNHPDKKILSIKKS